MAIKAAVIPRERKRFDGSWHGSHCKCQPNAQIPPRGFALAGMTFYYIVHISNLLTKTDDPKDRMFDLWYIISQNVRLTIVLVESF